MNIFNKVSKTILALLKGHYTVFKHSFKKRVTIEYPEIKPVLNERFRGKHEYCFDKCIFCGICVKSCPTSGIKLSKEDQSYVIDMNKCIFCGNCEYYCPKNAVKLSKDFELASSQKSDLTLDFTPFSEIIEDKTS